MIEDFLKNKFQRKAQCEAKVEAKAKAEAKGWDNGDARMEKVFSLILKLDITNVR